MSYNIGGRRFPEISRLYQDAQGKEPREISEAPIQHVNLVNVPGASIVAGFVDWNADFFPSQRLTWTFTNGAYDDGIFLPSDRMWKIVFAAANAGAAGPTLRWKAFLNEQEQTAIAADRFTVHAVGATGSRTQLSQMIGQILPFGGELWGSGANLNVVDCGILAIGVYRGTVGFP